MRTPHLRQRWADGGATDLDDGVLLCAFHHGVVHDRDIEIRIRDRTAWFRRPGHDTWIRNHRWRL